MVWLISATLQLISYRWSLSKPLKISGKLGFFYVFRRYRKGPLLSRNGLMKIQRKQQLIFLKRHTGCCDTELLISLVLKYAQWKKLRRHCYIYTFCKYIYHCFFSQQWINYTNVKWCSATCQPKWYKLLAKRDSKNTNKNKKKHDRTIQPTRYYSWTIVHC